MTPIMVRMVSLYPAENLYCQSQSIVHGMINVRMSDDIIGSIDGFLGISIRVSDNGRRKWLIDYGGFSVGAHRGVTVV